MRTDGFPRTRPQEEMRNLLQYFSTYSFTGIDFNHLDAKVDNETKEHYIKQMTRMKPFKEYMIEAMDAQYGAFWFLTVPLTVVIYLFQMRATKKYLDKNQEFLI